MVNKIGLTRRDKQVRIRNLKKEMRNYKTKHTCQKGVGSWKR